jgi:hypothetical protein
VLRRGEFDDLVAFVRTGLLDRRTAAQHLCSLVPAALPSGARAFRAVSERPGRLIRWQVARFHGRPTRCAKLAP